MLRLLDRHDTPLATGLILGAIVVFHQPLRALLEVARDIEMHYQLDLLPALVVLCFAFALHQSRKRHEAKLAARTATADAQHQAERARDLERLVAFGQAVANAPDFATLHRAVWRHVTTLAGDRKSWIAFADHGQLHLLTADDDAGPPTASQAIRAMADRALAAVRDPGDERTGVGLDGFLCFPLVAGSEAMGVLGIAEGRVALDPRERRSLGAAAAVLAIAVRNIQMMMEMRWNSLRDALTGCYNHAYALETLDAELRRAKRSGNTPSVVMLDVDTFKTINDTHGHLVGDQVLIAVANKLTDLFRSSDPKCRYGGDEFFVILPETPLRCAEQLAERLRRDIAALTVLVDGKAVVLTASVGVTAAVSGELDLEAVIARADRAMYEAKQAGRNQCCSVMPDRPPRLMVPTPSGPATLSARSLSEPPSSSTPVWVAAAAAAVRPPPGEPAR